MAPDTLYRILLFAVNPKGRSEPVVIDGITFKGVAKYTGTADGLDLELSPLMAALAVASSVLFVISCCVLLAMYRRHSNKYGPLQDYKTYRGTQSICVTFIPPRYTSPASPDEQKMDEKLSKYSVTARMANGQMTTTTVQDGSQAHFLPLTSQIESTRQLRSPTAFSSPSVLGVMECRDGLSMDQASQQTRVNSQSEVEEVDPDVIPNQYGEYIFRREDGVMGNIILGQGLYLKLIL